MINLTTGNSTSSLTFSNNDTFVSWFKDNLAEYAYEIYNYGADNGFPPISYTHDLVAIFNEFEDEIWDITTEIATELGHSNVLTWVITSRRSDMLDTVDGFKSLMVWLACEEIARLYRLDCELENSF